MFDCSDFLKIAQDCHATWNSEASHRTAIGRAYYAAYHSAHQFAEGRGKRFSKNSDAHFEVVAALSEIDVNLGHDLDDLKSMRRRADYELSYSGDKIADDVQSALDNALFLLQQLRRR